MKYAKKFLAWIILACLFLIAACSTGTVAKSSAPLTPAEQEELDPMFWKMWGSSRGLGP